MDDKNDTKQNDQDKDTIKDKIIKILPETTGSVGGALVGLAVGGPVGAIAGATITPAAIALSRVAQQALQRRAERAERVLAEASEISGKTLSELETELTENDENLAFAIKILTSAADTPLEQKIIAFSKLLANRIQEKSKQPVDKYLIIADALAALDETHIFALAKISSSKEDKHDPISGWTPAQLSAEFGEPPEVLRPIVRVLELHGLITDAGHRDPPEDEPIRWQITEIGLFTLQLLGYEK